MASKVTFVHWRPRALNGRAEALAAEAVRRSRNGEPCRRSWWRFCSPASLACAWLGALGGAAPDEHAGCGRWLALVDAPLRYLSSPRTCFVYNVVAPLPGLTRNQAEFFGLRTLLHALCAVSRTTQSQSLSLFATVYWPMRPGPSAVLQRWCRAGAGGASGLLRPTPVACASQGARGSWSS